MDWPKGCEQKRPVGEADFTSPTGWVLLWVRTAL
jgi:hypothetical protein